MDDTPPPIVVTMVKETPADEDLNYPYIYWPRLFLYVVTIITLLSFSNRLFWWTDLMVHFRFHYALLLALVAIYFLALSKRRLALIAALGVCLNIGAIITSLPMINTAILQNSTMPPGQFTLVSYNVHSQNPHPEVVLPWLRELKPDVAILIEANRSWQPVFDQLVDVLPYQTLLHSSGNFGVAILSRSPLDGTKTDTAGSFDLPVLSTEVETPVGRLCLIAVHPSPPLGADDSIARNAYLAQVTAMAQTRGKICVLAGDFNATPWSAGFDALRTLPNLQPSVLYAPASWPSSLGSFGLPIDHILLTMPFGKTRPLQITKIAAGPNLPGSDHRPIIGVIEAK